MKTALIIPLVIINSILLTACDSGFLSSKNKYAADHSSICIKSQDKINEIMESPYDVDIVNGCLGKESAKGKYVIYMNANSILEINYDTEPFMGVWDVGAGYYGKIIEERAYKRGLVDLQEIDYDALLKSSVVRHQINHIDMSTLPIFGRSASAPEPLEFEQNFGSKNNLALDLKMKKRPSVGMHVIAFQTNLKLYKEGKKYFGTERMALAKLVVQ